MRGLAVFVLLILLAGCENDEFSWISIRNDTDVPIYAQPFTSEYSNPAWIQPGKLDEFYSIRTSNLDGFEYFSFYYDSLIILMDGLEDQPVKFFQDGTTVNYNPTLNPFTNPDMWWTRKLNQAFRSSNFGSGMEEKEIYEHFFCIEKKYVKSLADTIVQDLYPAD